MLRRVLWRSLWYHCRNIARWHAIKSSTGDVWGRYFSWPAILHDLPTHSHRLQFSVTLRHSVCYGNTLCADAETIRSVFYVDTCSQKKKKNYASKTVIPLFEKYFTTNHNRQYLKKKIIVFFAKKKHQQKMVYMYNTFINVAYYIMAKLNETLILQ